jgi:hypothetical protein
MIINLRLSSLEHRKQGTGKKDNSVGVLTFKYSPYVEKKKNSSHSVGVQESAVVRANEQCVS